MNTLAEQIMVAVEKFQHCREVEDWECIQKLIADGIEQRTALKLIQFVPLAFCRYMLKDTGVKFSANYHLVETKSNKSFELSLEDEPIYRESLVIAEKVFYSGLGQQYYYSVAGRSAEMNAINSALNAGSKFEDMACKPPIIASFSSYFEE